ncbi:hypothetical protein JCM14076_10520 [Methylosoma difficile]
MNKLKLMAGALCLALAVANSFAQEPAINLSSEQIANLGVSVGKLNLINELPLLVAPAKVAIPANQDYIVSASQSGLVTHLAAAVANPVKKGQVLAQINSPALLELQGQYLKANSLLQLATAAFNRDKKLLSDGVIATRREQETLSQYNAAVLDVNQAKQLLAIAGMPAGDIAALGKNQLLNGQLNITAPISGVVIERLVTAGARVDNQTPLYRIANLDTLWLDINIPQERIADIKIGDRVQLDNSSHLPPIDAAIIQLGINVNPDNQTVLARALVKNPTDALVGNGLRAGQKINIKITQPLKQAAYSVANTALAQYQGQAVVFVRTPGGFSAETVQVLGKQGDLSVITGNFTGSEEIAIAGAAALKANWLGLGSDE